MATTEMPPVEVRVAGRIVITVALLLLSPFVVVLSAVAFGVCGVGHGIILAFEGLGDWFGKVWSIRGW
jgi:hypothetical protein